MTEPQKNRLRERVMGNLGEQDWEPLPPAPVQFPRRRIDLGGLGILIAGSAFAFWLVAGAVIGIAEAVR